MSTVLTDGDNSPPYYTNIPYPMQAEKLHKRQSVRQSVCHTQSLVPYQSPDYDYLTSLPTDSKKVAKSGSSRISKGSITIN